jgi:hypothetical protein
VRSRFAPALQAGAMAGWMFRPRDCTERASRAMGAVIPQGDRP